MSENLKAAVPVLPAIDVEASLAWWVQICGFTERFRHGSPPTYAGVARGGASVHLNGFDDPKLGRKVAEQTVVRFVVEDADAMHAEFVQRGGTVHPNGALADKPWGTREFATIDPTGVLVWFTQALD